MFVTVQTRSIARGITRFALLALMNLAIAQSSFAQVSADEHAKHHPAADQNQPPTTQSTMATSGMGEMSGMMEGMGSSQKKELYPSLMDISEFTPEKRKEIELQANESMKAGTDLIATALDRLNKAVAGNDYALMQNATLEMHEGLSRFESGVAAHRALTEGKPPQDVALQWFRSEMNLPQATVAPTEAGTSFFHAAVMTILVLFAVVMIGMYFFKMRRAALLLQGLTGASSPVPAPTSSASLVSRQTPATAAPAAAPRPTKWSGKLSVGRIFEETPNIKTFRLMNPLGGSLPFSFLPGQFLTVVVPINGKTVRRSYTIASSPTQHDYVEITVKHQEHGEVSAYLNDQVKVGDLLEFSGPGGSFIFTGRECKCILLIAGGVGITPLMSVIRYLTDRSWPGDIYLLYSVSKPHDIIFREELEYLQRRHSNLRVAVTVSRPEGTDWKGATGRLSKEFITASVPKLSSRYVHVCGPVPMMESAKKMLAELGVLAERIKTEAFGPALGKPEPSLVPEPSAAVGADTATSVVTFSESGKSGPLPSDKSVLDVADGIGVEIDNSCRVGTCGICRVKLLSGKVTMQVEEGLEPGDKENGIILACQAKSTGDITVQA